MEARNRAEEDLQRQLDAEAEQREQARIAGVLNVYAQQIQQRVKRYWVKPSSAEAGLIVTLEVKLIPGGDVKSVRIINSSGNALFDRSAENAVYKAAPMPMPSDADAAEEIIREGIQFEFKPE